MKVNQNTRRFWQIVILAISVLACASWNQTTEVQKNINSNPQKNILDHAKFRQASLHSTDSDNWVVCNGSRLNSLESNSYGQMDEAHQKVENCSGMIHYTRLSQPDQKTSIVVGTPVFCQETRYVTDVLQGQGYFSGFTKPLEAIDSTNVLGQMTSESAAVLPMNIFKMSTLSADVVYGSSATRSDANGSNVEDSFDDAIVLAVASGCSVK